MWKQRRKEIKSRDANHASEEARLKLQSRSDRKRDVMSRMSPEEKKEEKHGNIYQRQLLQLEESDPTRWGHSGYKELHPEDFVSSLSEEEELDEEPSRAKRKKNGGKDSKQKHKKSKKKKKHKDEKSKSKHKQSS
jgi:hypothetical protein